MRPRTRAWLGVVPWLWLGVTVVWTVVIFVTDQLGWPLAMWIAASLGPLAVLRARLDAGSAPGQSSSSSRT